jgi:DNA-binding XRE family transcriptional regulator
MKFDTGKLRQLRKIQGKSINDIAQAMHTSETQVYRLENGQRRLTVDAMQGYCAALNINPAQLFDIFTQVPITGYLDDQYAVSPILSGDKAFITCFPLVPDMDNTAALVWQSTGRFQPMSGHVYFYYAHREGIRESSWGQRSLLQLADGTRRIGWPVEEKGAVHIDSHESRAEFNVDLIWASPILAVAPPFLIQQWQILYEAEG